MRAGKAGLLLAAAFLLPGCVAAIPAGAAVLMGRKQLSGGKQPDAVARPAPPAAMQAPPVAAPPAAAAIEIPPAPPALPPAVPTGMQYLYGSGEAAAASAQAYRALSGFLAARAADRKAGRAVTSVVLAEGASIETPRLADCGRKPLAVVLDIDETAILNLGFEADDARRGGAFDEGRWSRWEQSGGASVVAAPGAAETVAAARGAGIEVIYNSNRSAENATYTEVTLDIAGLGPAKHGETLWLRGDDATGSAKDGRRWTIARTYCVVALVGDQLGDFSDLFNTPGLPPAARRIAAGAPGVASLWGNGWFILPNPVYGSALKGGFDDVFPADKSWSDPAEEKK